MPPRSVQNSEIYESHNFTRFPVVCFTFVWCRIAERRIIEPLDYHTVGLTYRRIIGRSIIIVKFYDMLLLLSWISVIQQHSYLSINKWFIHTIILTSIPYCHRFIQTATKRYHTTVKRIWRGFFQTRGFIQWQIYPKNWSYTTVLRAKFLNNNIQEFCAHHGGIL